MSYRLINEEFFVEAQIDHILAWFDFNKVRSAMIALDWTWVGGGDTVPEIEELRYEAIRLLKASVKDRYTSCGGLVAERVDLENGDFYLKLGFEVSDWDSFDFVEESKPHSNKDT